MLNRTAIMRNLRLRLLVILPALLYTMISPVVITAAQLNKFVFTQLRYDGQWDPYPETWGDIIEFLATATSISPQRERRVASIDDKELFSSPFLVILGSESFPKFNKNQRELFRRYLSNGGIVLVEDSSAMRGGAFDSSFRSELAAVFPELKLKKLPIDHPLMRSYYFLRKVSGRRLVNNFVEGIDISGRTALIYSQNDLFGAWARDRMGNYLWECAPSGQPQRFEAQKLTMNIIMYSVTGTYKSDAIHRPFLEQKMNR